jgi:pyruvate dehydrogenase E1 component alpha subunit
VNPRAARSGSSTPSGSSTRNGRAAAGKKPPQKEPEAAGQELEQYFRLMLLIRRFEEKTAEMYQRARIGGYCHLNLGEEATCVGLSAGMRPTDYLFTNYREHGYAVARGMDPGRVMAELFGREQGVSHGRGGSMHLFDWEKRLLGGYAIVGGQLPLATGAGLAIIRQHQDDVVVCQMGDATTNIGAFHESLNIAALWKLPVVYAIVNNGFGMGTSVSAGSAVPQLAQKGCAYGIEGVEVDGNDVLATRDAVRDAVERARKEHLPSLLDIKSFRLKGHSVVDPDRYRADDYLRQIRSQDPLLRLRQQLKTDGVLDEDAFAKLEEEIDREVEAAVEFAEESPEPDPRKLFEFSYATEVDNQPRALPGQDPWV